MRGLRPEAKIPVERFRLDPAYAEQPATFALEFKSGGKLYEYGFECDRDRIHREWLQTFTRKTETILFERHTPAEGKTKVKLGPSATALPPDDQAFLEFVARGTRPNQLYVHECIESKEVQYIRLRWQQRRLCADCGLGMVDGMNALPWATTPNLVWGWELFEP